ncbi:MAG: transporter substrate-binding domain-containing protein [Spirochaetales bacterium]|nr:transporter substrate-binding domain-containing protein [Spirochaetales bacterium]
MFGALKTPARIEKLYYSDPYRSEQISLFVRRNSKLVFDGNLEKIKDHSFGVIRDFSYGKKLDKFLHTELEKRRVEWVVDTERNIAKLIKGRFDILIADHFSAMHTIRNMKVKGKIRSLEPPVTDNNIYVAFSRKRKLSFLRDHFNMALRSMREDGTLDLIMKKYVD